MQVHSIQRLPIGRQRDLRIAPHKIRVRPLAGILLAFGVSCTAMLGSAEAVDLADGYEIRTLANIFQPRRIDFDAEGNWYTGNGKAGSGAVDEGKVRFISSDGRTIREVGNTLPDPDGLILDRDGHVVAAGNVIVGAGGSLREVDVITGATSTLFSGAPLSNVASMAFDSRGRLLVGQGGSTLTVVENGVLGVFASGFADTFAVSVDPVDNIYVGSRQTGEIFRLDPDGVQPRELIATIPGGVDALAITDSGPFAGPLWSGRRGVISSVNIDTGEFTTFATGLGEVDDIVFGAEGEMYISDPLAIRNPDGPALGAIYIIGLARVRGDLNGDGFVGADDLTILIENWNLVVPEHDWSRGDATGDGFVGADDLSRVIENWNLGTLPAAAAAVPEPGAATLLLPGGLALLVRGRSRNVGAGQYP